MTDKVYLSDCQLLKLEGATVACADTCDDRQFVVLDKTIFYAQGGGQPFDTGVMEGAKSKFKVEDVRMKEGGVVHHYGTFDGPPFEADETVTLTVDKERRHLNMRLHSAGHLLDVAVHNLKFEWIPGRGYHFPDAPFVEYDGDIPAPERESAKERIQEEVNRLIKQGYETEIQNMGWDQAVTKCGAEMMECCPQQEVVRIVAMSDSTACPCGGTHVKNTSDIGEMKITKIGVKKKKVKVAYVVA